MTSKKWLNFCEAIEKSNDFMQKYSDLAERNILLGNGFSIDCCKDIFSYKSLFDNVNFSETLNNVFKVFATVDFEKIIKKIQESSTICKIYGFDNEKIQTLQEDSELIKKELVRVISEKHPAHRHMVKQHQLYSALVFLSNFNRIFTLNYDMLLYWALMTNEDYKKLFNENKKEVFSIYDGFWLKGDQIVWDKKQKQNIFYLHGALHLFDNGIDIIKEVTNSTDYLIGSIKNRLEQNQYPLIVAEGLSEQKLEIITHNKYLENAFEKISDIVGCVFIHGHSLDDNDNHILKAIFKNQNIKQVYISVFEPEKNFDSIYDKAYKIFVNRKRAPKELYFYDATSANVWNSITEKDVILAEFGFKGKGNE